VRTALGASRPRVLLQMFAETLVLTLIATGLGLFASDRFYGWAFGQLVATPIGGTAVPYWADLGVTPRGRPVGDCAGRLQRSGGGGSGADQSHRTRRPAEHPAAGGGAVRHPVGRATSVLIVLDVALTVCAPAHGAPDARGRRRSRRLRSSRQCQRNVR
jgi:hypothetical protein